MDKAILVIDMPSCCYECPLCESLEVLPSVEEYYCTVENNDVDRRNKPNWCPLKPMPKKKLPYITSSNHLIGFGEGYNACIDEILGD